jgi:hypothetical protein
MSWEALHAVAWMSVAAIAAWLLIDAFRSGRTIGSRHDNLRAAHPGAFWMVQCATVLVLGGAIYGLFRTFETMNVGG